MTRVLWVLALAIVVGWAAREAVTLWRSIRRPRGWSLRQQHTRDIMQMRARLERQDPRAAHRRAYWMSGR
jgi:hypothetical protein